MVDFSVFGDYQNPVEFNFSTAEGFSSQLRWTSQRINIFDARTSLVESIASREFRGFFATVFTQNIHVCSADAMALSEALTTAADMVDYLAEQARLENKRRQQVRDFAAQHDDFGDHVRDFFTGVDVPPNLTPAESPSPPAAPSACDRRSSAGSVDSSSLTSADGLDGSSRRWVYDTAGRLVTTTCQDAGTSQICHYDYDLAGELVSTVTQLGPGDSTVETHYQYDPCGRRIKAASSAGIREEFRWDSRRWLAGVMTLRAGRSQEFATHVDAFGCLTDVSGPAGRTPIAWDLATGESRLVQVGDIPALPLPDGSVLTPVSADSDQDEPWRRPATDPLDPYTLIQEHLTADISMTGGHLGVAGLAWMGARVYDSTTASFLTIDPLAAPPGSLWEAASYGYAATNPLALADPLGLRPVTDAQMRQFASTIDTRNLWDRHIRNVFSWETLGGIALATAGGLLMCFGAEVPGAMLIGAGGDMVFQQVVRGHVDYGECCLVRSVGTYGRLGTQRNRRSRNSNSPHPRDRSRHNPRLRDGQLPLGNITRAPQRRNLPRASRRRNTQRRRLRRHHRHDRRKSIRHTPRLNTHRTLRTP
ncbi:RHS repeat-associated core domain protein [Cutibacterium acnes J139]|nr:RHS repeat-associated core domain protein [Cutibacterium acnes J139]